MENQTSGGKTFAIATTIILTAVVVSGAMYLWQKNNAAKQEIQTSPTVTNTDSQKAVALKIDPITLQNTQAIETCANAERKLPAAEIQKQLGVNSLMDDGYEMIDICREGADRLSFLLAKNEPNSLSGGTSACVNRCDRVVFGTVSLAEKEAAVVLSGHRLGIYAESYNQFCRIDTAEEDGNKLYLYCGSGESGGLTTWYSYTFGDDDLIEVQRMNELGPPEVFDIKEPDVLKKFRFKSNAEMK